MSVYTRMYVSYMNHIKMNEKNIFWKILDKLWEALLAHPIGTNGQKG